MAEALPPLTFLPPLIPLLLTFELCTERWETWPCLPGRLTKAAAATALCSWEEEEKEWGTPLTPTEETPWDSWPWEVCGQEEEEGAELEPVERRGAVPPPRRRAATNLLDGVVLNDAGALAGLVVVL